MISTILCNKNTNMLPKHLIYNPQTQAGSIEPALVIMNTTCNLNHLLTKAFIRSLLHWVFGGTLGGKVLLSNKTNFAYNSDPDSSQIHPRACSIDTWHQSFSPFSCIFLSFLT